MISCQFENGVDAKLRHATAGVILLNNEGKMCMVKRSQCLHTEPGKWTLPAGYMERGQTCPEAALAECVQESGYEATITGIVCILDDPDRPDSGRQNVGMVFLAEAGDKISVPDNEQTEWAWFNTDDLPPSEEIAFEYEKVVEHYIKNGAQPLELLFLS